MVRFDMPCRIVSGAVEYFREHMALGDYLTEEGQAEMTWVGKGCERLGIRGRCELTHFENLCRGLHPETGAKLMVRDKGANRRVCYFGQISPPKDVSLLYLVGGETRIGGWWQDAMRETLAEIEAVTATRVRRDGADDDRCTGNMVAAIVTHDASRALDPQLHTHVCIMNLTYDAAEERWKGVQPSGYFKHQGYFREVCYNKLAARFLDAGYELEQVRGIGFNIAGMPATLRDRFSKRRRTIVERAAMLGATTQDAWQTIAGQTREAKTHSTAKDLRNGWLAEAGGELTELRAVVARAVEQTKETPSMSASDALLSGEAHLFERRSVADERVVLREALVAGRGQVDLSGLKGALADRILNGELVRSESEVASREGLASEKEFVAWASTAPPVGRWGVVPDMAGLGSDQVAAVERVMSATGRVLILQGDAGTGKTTCLKAIIEGIQGGDGRVFGCAPSAGAADVLRRELTGDADTLQQLLVNPDLQRATRDRVLLVDEAGLVSVREMRDLCRLAAANGNRLLLVGDVKQHSSVEAGDALRCLQYHGDVPVLRLTEIRRQKKPAYREAVRLLARGQATEALRQFARLGAVTEIHDLPALFRAAATDYVRTVQGGKSCLAISPVWSEIHAFTDEARRQLQSAGLLAREEQPRMSVFPLKWTREQRRRAENYQAGDVLTFHRDSDIFRQHERVTVVGRTADALIVREPDGEQFTLNPRTVTGFDVGISKTIPVAVGDRLQIRANLKPAGLRNGDLVTVAQQSADGILLADGRKMPQWFVHFTHGYATTSHAAQGKTIDHGILIMADAGISGGSLKQAYVSNSRFREDQMIFTSDAKMAREAMMRSGHRKLAIEMEPAPVVEVESSPTAAKRRHIPIMAAATGPRLRSL